MTDLPRHRRAAALLRGPGSLVGRVPDKVFWGLMLVVWSVIAVISAVRHVMDGLALAVISVLAAGVNLGRSFRDKARS